MLSSVIHRTISQLLCLCFFLLTVSAAAHENGVVTVVVPQGSNAIIPCSPSTKENIESVVFDCKKDGKKEVFFYDAGFHYNNGRAGQDVQFRGRVSHFQDQLKHGNASIVIRNIKMDDGGNYSCVFPRLFPPGQTCNIELIVERTFRDRSGEFPGVVPEPYTRILNTTEDGVQLKCEVRGAFPEPKLEWRDGDGSVLPSEEPQVSYRDGYYNVSLLTTVTKTTTNRFTCVAKQEALSHVVDAEIHVPDQLFESCQGVDVRVVWILGVLIVVAALALFFVVKHNRKHMNKGSQQWRCSNKAVAVRIVMDRLLLNQSATGDDVGPKDSSTEACDDSTVDEKLTEVIHPGSNQRGSSNTETQDQDRRPLTQSATGDDVGSKDSSTEACDDSTDDEKLTEVIHSDSHKEKNGFL